MNLRSRHRINTGFNQSSMTDLVFLLLIFFIIVSTLISPYALPVDLPSGKNRTKQKPIVSVSIQEDLTHYVNEKEVKPERIEQVLLKEMKGKGKKRAIKLHVDQKVPTGKMVRVLTIAKKNDWNIALATEPEE
ncbi:MAG: ExbD/TolR family protein [Flavobacteriales bacterium]